MNPQTHMPQGYRPPSYADDASTEAALQEKGKTAPRITPADIAAAIIDEHYFNAREGVEGAARVAGPYHESLGLLTFCVLVLRNGFTVTGESACASAANFDAEIGRRIARENAVRKVWPLLGYQLREFLHQRDTAGDEAA